MHPRWIIGCLISLVFIVPSKAQVVDSSFELGVNSPYWNSYADSGFDIICCDPYCPYTPHEGSCMSWFGGITNANETGFIQQSLNIPTGTTQVGFWMSWEATLQTELEYVDFKVKIDGTVIGGYTFANAAFYDLYWRDTKVNIPSTFANNGPHVLRFEFAGMANNSIFVDQVVFVTTPGATTGSNSAIVTDKKSSNTTAIVAGTVVAVVVVVAIVVIVVIFLVMRSNKYKHKKSNIETRNDGPAPNQVVQPQPQYHSVPAPPIQYPENQSQYPPMPNPGMYAHPIHNNPSAYPQQQQAAPQYTDIVRPPGHNGSNVPLMGSEPTQNYNNYKEISSAERNPISPQTRTVSGDYQPFGGSNEKAYGNINPALIPPPATKAKGVDIDFLELEEMMEIGRGSFGIVYRGAWRSIPVAIKILNKDSITEKAISDFRSEAEILKSLRNHPNVVLFLGITSSPQPISLVTEYCAKGSLHRFLKSDVPIDFDMQLKIAQGTARGMLHLHAEKLIHRDLAARNILLTENFEPKVSDFGLTRPDQETDSNKTLSDIGPLKWMSPESIVSKSYSFASDVWSFGVVLWEIASRTDPYPGLEPINVAMGVCYENLRLPVPPFCDPVFAELMVACWNTDPAKRPTFKEICTKLNSRGGEKSPVISGHSNNSNSSTSTASRGNLSGGTIPYAPTEYGSMDKINPGSAPAPTQQQQYISMPPQASMSVYDEPVVYGVPQVNPPGSE